MRTFLTGSLAALIAALAATETRAADDGWVQLFNGKDFTGWKMPEQPGNELASREAVMENDKVVGFKGTTKARKGRDGKETTPQTITLWQIKDGCMVGGGPASHIFSEKGDYENFHYRVECKINDKGNSGQYFRAEFGGGYPKGYEAQINATHGDPVKTGSLYPSNGIDRDEKHLVKKANHKPDEWFTQEVIAVGPKVTIIVNGKTEIEYTIPGDKYFKKGHFALQGHDPGSVMTFRKVEVKEIK